MFSNKIITHIDKIKSLVLVSNTKLQVYTYFDYYRKYLNLQLNEHFVSIVQDVRKYPGPSTKQGHKRENPKLTISYIQK